MAKNGVTGYYGYAAAIALRWVWQNGILQRSTIIIMDGEENFGERYGDGMWERQIDRMKIVDVREEAEIQYRREETKAEERRSTVGASQLQECDQNTARERTEYPVSPTATVIAGTYHNRSSPIISLISQLTIPGSHR